MAKTIPQPEEFRLTYDLATCTDPLVRLGIHGLYRMLYHAGLPRYASLYPKLKQSPTLKWTLTDTTVEIVAKTPADLTIILNSMVGDMPQGVLIPPGYPSNSETDPEKFYLTANTHTAITGFLFPSSNKAGRTKSFGGTLEVRPEKAHPEDAVGLPVKNGTVSVLDLVCKLKGSNPNNLLKKVSGCKRKDGSPIEQKITVHCPDPTLSKSILFKSLGEQLVASLCTTNKFNMSRPVAMSTPYHPLCGTWENKSIKMPFVDAFAVYFSPFAYVYTTCSQGFIGVGLDFPSFKESSTYHGRHIQGFLGSRKEGFIFRVNGNSQVAAFVLLSHLGCPTGHVYPVVSMSGDDATAWDFYYRAGPGEGLYGKFQEALEGGMEYEDAKNTLRVLRLVPLEPHGDKYKSVYDQVYQNLTSGSVWHHNLGKVVAIQRDVAKSKKEKHKGLFFPEAQALQVLVEIMQNDKEKMILAAANKLLNSVARKFEGMGYPQTKYDRAREFMVTVNLSRAVGKSSLLEALWRVQLFAEHIVPEDVLQAIHDMASSNPRDLKNLLILGTQSYNPKAPATVEAN